MNNSTPITEDTLLNAAPTTTAGAVLRGYRLAHGVELDALAKALRVSAAKLSALENDQLDALPDACLLYTSPSPRDYAASRMPSSA